MSFDNDLTGNKVKGYTVIGFAGNDSRRKSLWSCQCDKCNAIRVFRGDGILREEIAVCECKRAKASQFIDMTGWRFGDWLVLQKAESLKKGVKWLCQCDCGTKQEIYGSTLRAGNSKSCRKCASRKRQNKLTGDSQACAALKGGHYAGDKPPMAERAQAIRNREMALSGVPIKAYDICQQAIDTMRERGKTYDKDDKQEERSMGKTVAAFNAITGQNLSEEQGWLFMVMLKMARAQQGEYKDDNYLDGTAYFALAGEAASIERKK